MAEVRTALVTGATSGIAIAPGRAYTGGSPREGLTALGKTTLLSRTAEAEEIGYVVAFLASPAAGYITGAVIPVDSGGTAV